MFDFVIVGLSALALVLSVAGLISGRAGAVMARPLEQAAPDGGHNAVSAVATKAVTNHFTVQPAFDLLGTVCGGLLERLAGWRSHASKRVVFWANQVGVAGTARGNPSQVSEGERWGL